MISSIIAFVFLALGIFSYIYFSQDFQVKQFQDSIDLAYNTSFNYNEGNICYGNKYKCFKVTTSHEGTVDTTKIGSYKVTYYYKYKTKTLTKIQTINVKDYEAPSITIEENNFNVCPNLTNPNFNVRAYDNYDLDITSKVTQYIKDNKVYFSVTDSSNNKTEISRDLTYNDLEKPTITLNGNSIIYLKVNETYQELGAKAIDNCDGDISAKITISGNVETSKPGEYKITYSVQDSYNNTQSITRKVYVYPDVNNYPAPKGSTIYLTFDDGPSAYTSKLLDVLAKYNIKATFFVTNQSISKGYDNVILRAYQEGHTIGLHSDTHNYNIYQNAETYFQDLYAIQEKVKAITGYTSMIIRFPGGSSNTVSRKYDGGTKIMSELTKAVEAKGFRYFDWNISSGDA